jgi:hypothetical protein
MKVMEQRAMDPKLVNDVQGEFSAKDVSHDFILYAFSQ